MHLYEKRVFALAVRMCGNPEDAAEAAQEAFLAAWQGLRFFRGDSSFSTWLYRLTSNACVDLLRREGRHRSAAGPSLDDEELNRDVPDTAPSPQEEAERRELRAQIEEGLRALSPEHRQVLVLREMHQLSYDEIAGYPGSGRGDREIPDQPGPEATAKLFVDQAGTFWRPHRPKEQERRAANEILRGLCGPAGPVYRR